MKGQGKEDLGTVCQTISYMQAIVRHHLGKVFKEGEVYDSICIRKDTFGPLGLNSWSGPDGVQENRVGESDGKVGENISYRSPSCVSPCDSWLLLLKGFIHMILLFLLCG